MPRVAHFEIYTDNPEAVQSFYREIFGWNFQKFEGGPVEYWLITTGPDDQPGINGGVTRPREGQNPGTLNTIAVASLEPNDQSNRTTRWENLRSKDGDPPESVCSPTPKIRRATFLESSSRIPMQSN